MFARLRRNDTGASISSYIWTAAEMLHVCHANGVRGYVDMQSGPGRYYDGAPPNRNAWEWGFEQTQASADDIARNPHETWYWDDPLWRRNRLSSQMPWNATTDDAIAKLKEVLPTVLKFNDAIRTRAACIFQRSGLDPKKTIAVSHRGTDKHKECAISPAHKYFGHIDRLLHENPGWSVWVQAEESATSDLFTSRYRSAVVVGEFFKAPGSQTMVDWINPRSGYQKAVDAMTMLCMFSECAALLKNCANISDLAAGLSRGVVIHC